MAGQTLVPHKTLTRDICGISTDFVFVRFTNTFMVHILQINKISTMIRSTATTSNTQFSASVEKPTTRTLLGVRDSIAPDLIAQGITEALTTKGASGNLLLGLGLEKAHLDNREAYIAIMKVVEEEFVPWV
eukprot:c1170_g1_i1.p2 GENE.c1170_g1_i1~~c1170_g1_i1.p2  ORF type:complete len:131 (-),score=32.87 c1170_g1_i1:42-434(-)